MVKKEDVVLQIKSDGQDIIDQLDFSNSDMEAY